MTLRSMSRTIILIAAGNIGLSMRAGADFRPGAGVFGARAFLYL